MYWARDIEDNFGHVLTFVFTINVPLSGREIWILSWTTQETSLLAIRSQGELAASSYCNAIHVQVGSASNSPGRDSS